MVNNLQDIDLEANHNEKIIYNNKMNNQDTSPNNNNNSSTIITKPDNPLRQRGTIHKTQTLPTQRSDRKNQHKFRQSHDDDYYEDENYKRIKQQVTKSSTSNAGILVKLQIAFLILVCCLFIGLYVWLSLRTTTTTTTTTLRTKTTDNPLEGVKKEQQQGSDALQSFIQSISILFFGRSASSPTHSSTKTTRIHQHQQQLRLITIPDYTITKSNIDNVKYNTMFSSLLSFPIKFFIRAFPSFFHNTNTNNNNNNNNSYKKRLKRKRIKYSSSYYLVSSIDEYQPLQRILHRIIRFNIRTQQQMQKEQRLKDVVDLVLYDEMEDFVSRLIENIENSQGTTTTTSRNIDLFTILQQQYNVMGQQQQQQQQQQKLQQQYQHPQLIMDLWIWCMIYLGEFNGFVNLDKFDLHLNSDIITEMTQSSSSSSSLDSWIGIPKIQENISGNDKNDRSHNLPAGMDKSPMFLFIPNKESDVAKQMVHYLLDLNWNHMDHFNTNHHRMDEGDYMREYTTHLIQVVHQEGATRQNDDDDDNESHSWRTFTTDCNNNHSSTDGTGKEDIAGNVCIAKYSSSSEDAGNSKDEKDMCCELISTTI